MVKATIFKSIIFSGLCCLSTLGWGQFQVKLESKGTEITNDTLISVSTLFSKEVSGLEAGDYRLENGEVRTISQPVRRLSDSDSLELHGFTYDVTDFTLSPNDEHLHFLMRNELVVHDFEETRSTLTFPINKPYLAIAIDASSNYYLVRSDTSLIEVYSMEGDSLTTIGMAGEGAGELQRPTDIEVLDEKIFVADGSVVEVYNLGGEHLYGMGEGIFSSAIFLKIMGDQVFCLDAVASSWKVQVFDLNGNHLRELDLTNTTERGFHFEVSQDQIFVGYEDEILILDHEGNLVGEIQIPISVIRLRGLLYDERMDQLYAYFYHGDRFDPREFIYKFASFQTYQVQVAPDTDGPVSITLEAASVTDAGGNENQESNTLKFVFDSQPPIPEILAERSFEFLPILVDIRFDQPVLTESFTLEDIELSHPESFEKVRLREIADATHFQLELDAKDFRVFTSLSMPDSAVQDLAGNYSLASNTWTIFFRLDVPDFTVALSSDFDTISTQESIRVTVDFSSETTDFDEKDVAIRGGTIDTFEGEGTQYTMSISLEPESLVFIQILEGVATDQYQIPNSSSNVIEGFVDRTRPIPSLSSDLIGSALEDELVLTLTFDDPVLDFFIDPVYCGVFPQDCLVASDIEVSGGNLQDFSKLGPGTYRLDVKLIAQQVEVSVPDSVALNIARLPNVASGLLLIDYPEGEVVLNSDKPGNFKLTQGPDYISMYAPTGLYEKGQMNMYDLHGRMVWKGALTNQHMTWSTSALPKGIYLLSIIWNDEVFHQKILLD